VERAVLGEPSLPGTVLRLPMVHGPGDYQHRLYPYLKRVDDGRPAVLLDEAMAGWRCTRGYVGDVAAAIALAATDPRAAGRVYYVGEAAALTEAEWVRAVGEAAGWTGEVVPVPRALFRDEVRDSFSQALPKGDGRLHVLLFVEGAELKGLRWERLCAPLGGLGLPGPQPARAVLPLPAQYHGPAVPAHRPARPPRPVRTAQAVQRARADSIAEARGRLGDTFSPGDYPADLARCYGVEYLDRVRRDGGRHRQRHLQLRPGLDRWLPHPDVLPGGRPAPPSWS
jgi:hypothetical protein